MSNSSRCTTKVIFWYRTESRRFRVLSVPEQPYPGKFTLGSSPRAAAAPPNAARRLRLAVTVKWECRAREWPRIARALLPALRGAREAGHGRAQGATLPPPAARRPAHSLPPGYPPRPPPRQPRAACRSRRAPPLSTRDQPRPRRCRRLCLGRPRAAPSLCYELPRAHLRRRRRPRHRRRGSSAAVRIAATATAARRAPHAWRTPSCPYSACCWLCGAGARYTCIPIRRQQRFSAGVFPYITLEEM